MFYYVFFLVLLFVSCLYLVFSRKKTFDRKIDARTLIVIGSGGHTAEMLRLISKFPSHYQPRLYLLASNDVTSRIRIIKTEELENLKTSSYEIQTIPRSRNVKQSYITSIPTTIYSLLSCILPVYRFQPDVVLCNGPGTCIPICIITYIFKKILRWHTKIVFIESICRVHTMSLSGRILIVLADHVLVQWQELHDKYPSTIYLGRLM